jgi:hypothetical protein
MRQVVTYFSDSQRHIKCFAGVKRNLIYTSAAEIFRTEKFLGWGLHYLDLPPSTRTYTGKKNRKYNIGEITNSK